ncbi:hypothetical protein ACIOEX_09295 [Streptomyces sp. NPDC087850]|uniref:hypothetical protein n=1 Tax=Streptomyces sp. NPDC087850 TaxID=3365809 RepID=UPI00381A9747
MHKLRSTAVALGVLAAMALAATGAASAAGSGMEDGTGPTAADGTGVIGSEVADIVKEKRVYSEPEQWGLVYPVMFFAVLQEGRWPPGPV